MTLKISCIVQVYYMICASTREFTFHTLCFFLLVLQTVATMDHIRLIWSTLAIASFVPLVVVLGCWLWCKYYKQQQVPPGPINWPLLGAVPELLSNWDRLHDWFLDYFRHTRSFRIPFQLNFTGVFTVDPACVEQLLKSKCYNYPKGPANTTIFQELLGHGIFNVDGDEWKQQRRVASFEFASSVLRNFSTDVFRECALKLIFHVAHNAQSSSTFDLQDLCMRMTLETTCRIGFGVELGCLSASLPDIPFARCFDDANYISFYRLTDPFWKLKQFMCVGKERELKSCMQVLDNFTYKVIQTQRTEMASAELFERTKMVRQDLLSRFTHLSTMGEEKLTNKTLRDIILNFIIAGRDTSAVTLTWFFYMMSCHPEVADKVFEEVCSIEQPNLGAQDLVEEAQFEAFAKLLTFETLGKMAYLQAALSETLRLFPAVPLNSKQAIADDVLPDGTVVKKGWLLGYVPYSMGRMKFIWGADALEFKPDRWLKNGIYQPESPCKFTAFQAGPRMCLGKDSAFLQMKLTAALVLRFFHIHLVPGHHVTYRTMLVLAMLHGLKVTVKKRDLHQHKTSH